MRWVGGGVSRDRAKISAGRTLRCRALRLAAVRVCSLFNVPLHSQPAILHFYAVVLQVRTRGGGGGGRKEEPWIYAARDPKDAPGEKSRLLIGLRATLVQQALWVERCGLLEKTNTDWSGQARGCK